MKITLSRPLDYDAAAIRCVMNRSHPDEDGAAAITDGDTLTLVLDLDTGKVRDWPAGKIADVHMKVVDEGSYYLLDRHDNVIVKREGDYVPHCVPGEFGDYFIASIGPDGVIEGWRPTANQIVESFFRDDS